MDCQWTRPSPTRSARSLSVTTNDSMVTHPIPDLLCHPRFRTKKVRNIKYIGAKNKKNLFTRPTQTPDVATHPCPPSIEQTLSATCRWQRVASKGDAHTHKKKKKKTIRGKGTRLCQPPLVQNGCAAVSNRHEMYGGHLDGQQVPALHSGVIIYPYHRLLNASVALHKLKTLPKISRVGVGIDEVRHDL